MSDPFEDRMRRALHGGRVVVDEHRLLDDVHAGARRRRRRRTTGLAAAAVLTVVGLSTTLAVQLSDTDTSTNVSTHPTPGPTHHPRPTASLTRETRSPRGAALGTTGVDGSVSGETWRVSAEDCSGSPCARVSRDDGTGWTTLRVIESSDPAAVTGSGEAPVESVQVTPDGRDGWVFGHQLWSTHDGGATWRPQLLTGVAARARLQMATDGGHVFALQPYPTRLWASDPTRDTWHEVSLPPGYSYSEGIAALDGTLAVMTTSPSTDQRTLIVSHDAGSTWHEGTLPCSGEFPPVRTTATAMFLTCSSGADAGMNVWRSLDGERWSVLARVRVSTYVDDTIPVDQGTVLLVTGEGGLLVTATGQQKVGPGLAHDQTSLFGTFVTPQRGYLVVAPPHRLLATTDGGRTWGPVD